MVMNTATVGAAVTPAVIETFFNHYLNRKPLAKKPTAHISYDEGIHLIRKFLVYASHHTVEEVQRFTSQWVPHPRWVVVEEVTIPDAHIKKSAEVMQGQLGHHGIERVGGKTWWQWRRPESELRAEWIEMRTDYQERKRTKNPGTRVMLYVHGGAYFFGSVDEHRYQLQRHARKINGRVFAPRYRLAPQFPFPCGLHDCLAVYLFLLTVQDPTHIILAGDSAGGGMVLSLLVTLRDQGIPLPAGAVLISPWCDLTHSFPSVAADNPLDYIPPYGFLQRPSTSWPPPNTDDMLDIQEGVIRNLSHNGQCEEARGREADAVQGFHVDTHPNPVIQNDNAASDGNAIPGPTANTVPGPGRNLSIVIDGKLIEVKDQIQMYASNQLISHPLVSPILQPSLGGLPPLLILTGGGEMLRDEQIYLAHKAANPPKYPPGDAFLDENPSDHSRDQINLWKPTDVQLQIWDDLCHVAPTLSFTRPAKYMYRSVAQFGAWALARAQKTAIEILDDDDVSVISHSSSSDNEDADTEKKPAKAAQGPRVGKAGDPLPAFKNHMIRQRVDRHGNIRHLEPASELPSCTLPPSQIGVIKEGPIKKWMAAKLKWDTKYASAKRKVQKRRAKEMAQGYQTFGDGEVPPPSALAGRRKTGTDLKEEKKKRSTGMSLWALWGSKHDEETMQREQEADKQPETTIASSMDGAGARPLDDTKTPQGKLLDKGEQQSYSRSRSRRRTVTDEHQTENDEHVNENTSAADLLAMKNTRREQALDSHLTPDFAANGANPTILVKVPTNEESRLKRPKIDGIAFPFTVKGHQASASMTTLTSEVGVPPAHDVRTEGVMKSGVSVNSADNQAMNGSSSEDANVMEENKTPIDSALDKGKGKEYDIAASSDVGERMAVDIGAGLERPQLETFVTAADNLPPGSAVTES